MQFSGTLDQENDSQFTIKNFQVSDKLKQQPHGKEFAIKSLKINTNLVGDVGKGKISLNDLVLRLNDNIITGKVEGSFKDGMRVNHQLHIKSLDLKAFEQLAALVGAPLAPSIEYVAYSPNKGNLIVTGTTQIDQLKADNLDISQLNIKSNYKSNVLSLEPITAKLYGGTLNAVTRINFSSPEPAYQGSGTLNNVSIQSMLSQMKDIDQISGNGNLKFDLTAIGTKGPRIKSSLNGVVTVSAQQGSIKNFDVGYFFKAADAAIKKQSLPDASFNKEGAFDSLTGSFVINHGHVKNEDLLLLAKDYKINGRGTLDLIAEQMDYHILANRIYHDGQEHPNALPVPIDIDGPFKNPRIAINIEALLRPVAKRELGKQIDKHLKKLFNWEDDDTPDSSQTAPSLKMVVGAHKRTH